MRGIVARWLLQMLGVGALVAASSTSFATEIKNLQLSTTADGTRAVFELNGPLDYKLFEIANPDRIVLDIRASSFAEGFATPVGRGLLKSVRTGKQGKDVRVVFDLAGGVRPKSFLLLPGSSSRPSKGSEALPGGPSRPSMGRIVYSPLKLGFRRSRKALVPSRMSAVEKHSANVCVS